MADLDSRSKRASSIAIMLSFVAAPVLPDGTIDQGDRQHVAFSYSGILATVADTELYPTRAGALGGVRAVLDRRGGSRTAPSRSGGVRVG